MRLASMVCMRRKLDQALVAELRYSASVGTCCSRLRSDHSFASCISFERGASDPSSSAFRISAHDLT
jgi:hypothetical protein